MLKRLGGLKANAKIPPLLIPALPCSQSIDKLCNGFFVPVMPAQKSCLHCLNYKKENCFSVQIKRKDIIENIIITWYDDEKWSIVHEILINNEKEYKNLANFKKFYDGF